MRDQLVSNAKLEGARVIPERGDREIGRQRNARDHMAKFALERIAASSGARTGVTTIHASYKDWCTASGLTPLHPKKFGQTLADLFQHTGTTVDEDNGQFTAIDIAIKPESRVLDAAE